MSDALELLRSIKPLGIVVNPFFFITFYIRKRGFVISNAGIVMGSCCLLIMVFYKVYFLLEHPVTNVQDYVDSYGSFISILLCFVSHFGYILNSKNIVKSLNEIISQMKLIRTKRIFKIISKIVTWQVIIAVTLPLAASIAFAYHYNLFDGEHSYWGYVGITAVDYFTKIHFAATSLLFSDCLLYCREIISKTNAQLLEEDVLEWKKPEKPINPIFMLEQKTSQTLIDLRMRSPSEDLSMRILIYDRVCQWCLDFNRYFGNPVTSCCMCNLVEMMLYSYFLTKYGLVEVWMCVIIFTYCFLQNWIILYACEKFREEIQNTQTIVNRLIIQTKNQKRKEVLQQFSILLLHRRIKFTACGLFTLDYKMIYSALATMATYLAIAFQFEYTGKPLKPSNSTTITI